MKVFLCFFLHAEVSKVSLQLTVGYLSRKPVGAVMSDTPVKIIICLEVMKLTQESHLVSFLC